VKKGVQLGSVLGCAAIAPIILIKDLKAGKGFEFQKIVRYQLFSMSMATALSVGMLLGKYSEWKNKPLCLQDRVYRIHNNKGQTRADIMAGCGFVPAFALGMVATRRWTHAFGFSSIGISLGLLYHILTIEKPNVE
jgi:hypothetical protein